MARSGQASEWRRRARHGSPVSKPQGRRSRSITPKKTSPITLPKRREHRCSQVRPSSLSCQRCRRRETLGGGCSEIRAQAHWMREFRDLGSYADRRRVDRARNAKFPYSHINIPIRTSHAIFSPYFSSLSAFYASSPLIKRFLHPRAMSTSPVKIQREMVSVPD